jgi:hypothetical protein
MAADIFQKLAKEGERANVRPNTRQSVKWFRDQTSKVGKVDNRELLKDTANMQSKMSKYSIGSMYHFLYNPKHRKTLPYYDRFPLIFVVDIYTDGFLGINLHYLPPMLRAVLMNGLYDITMKGNNDNKKLALSYNMLKRASKFKYFEPCVKRYLNGHVTSRFLKIPSDHWDIAVFMPTERFVKASKKTVWSESRKMVS